MARHDNAFGRIVEVVIRYSRGHSMPWIRELQKRLDRGDDGKGTGSSSTGVEEQGYRKW